MKTVFAFVGTLCLLAVASQAQVRTWGFSKDGVNEWAAAGDSVLLSNQAADTLGFDTVLIEPIGPAPQGLVVRFYRGASDTYYAVHTGSSNWGPNPRAITLPPNQSLVLRQFWADIDAPPLAKQSSGQAVGDTLRARLIFQASAGRGRDTLLVNGIQQTTAIRPRAASDARGIPGVGDAKAYDARGRRVDPEPAGSPARRKPVLTPKE